MGEGGAPNGGRRAPMGEEGGNVIKLLQGSTPCVPRLQDSSTAAAGHTRVYLSTSVTTKLFRLKSRGLPNMGLAQEECCIQDSNL